MTDDFKPRVERRDVTVRPGKPEDGMGPIRASEIDAAADKDQDTLERERTTRAVRARQARREALRRAGADVGMPSDSNISNLERRLAKREAEARAKRAARNVVKARLATRKGGAR